MIMTEIVIYLFALFILVFTKTSNLRNIHAIANKSRMVGKLKWQKQALRKTMDKNIEGNRLEASREKRTVNKHYECCARREREEKKTHFQHNTQQNQHKFYSCFRCFLLSWIKKNEASSCYTGSSLYLHWCC